MKASEVFASKRRLVLEVLGRYRVENPRVFGSVATGNDTEDSDIDILVDPLPGTTLFDLGGLQDELEEVLGGHVDLLTPGDLPQKFRRQVIQDARPL